MKDILNLENISAGYFKREVLRNVSMKIKQNTTALLIGPNGAGKSTLLRIIAGLLKPWKGKVVFEDRKLDGSSPAQRTRMGISYFLQGGETFGNLNVMENLQIAGMGLIKGKLADGIDAVLELFPTLKTMEKRRAGLLSGGEKHQLALGMVLVRKPKLMLLDEPSAGLSPLLAKEALESIKRIKGMLKTSVLLVEQNVSEGLKIADTVLLMKAGSIINEATPQEVISKNMLEQLFFE